jgi:hypothetical protein
LFRFLRHIDKVFFVELRDDHGGNAGAYGGQTFFLQAAERFPSSRCASATNIIRPLASTVATQPQLQSALLRLSAISRVHSDSVGRPEHGRRKILARPWRHRIGLPNRAERSCPGRAGQRDAIASGQYFVLHGRDRRNVGLFGVFLAVPAAALVHIVIDEFYLRPRNPDYAALDREAAALVEGKKVTFRGAQAASLFTSAAWRDASSDSTDGSLFGGSRQAAGNLQAVCAPEACDQASYYSEENGQHPVVSFGPRLQTF